MIIHRDRQAFCFPSDHKCLLTNEELLNLSSDVLNVKCVKSVMVEGNTMKFDAIEIDSLDVFEPVSDIFLDSLEPNTLKEKCDFPVRI